jgi:hypothetical protein
MQPKESTITTMNTRISTPESWKLNICELDMCNMSNINGNDKNENKTNK